MSIRLVLAIGLGALLLGAVFFYAAFTLPLGN